MAKKYIITRGDSDNIIAIFDEKTGISANGLQIVVFEKQQFEPKNPKILAVYHSAGTDCLLVDEENLKPKEQEATLQIVE